MPLAWEGKPEQMNDYLGRIVGSSPNGDEHARQKEGKDDDFDSHKSLPSRFSDLDYHWIVRTACFLAVENYHLKPVRILLQSGLVNANERNYHGQPLLHRATFRNNIELVKLLLDNDANIESEDSNGRTALTANADMRLESGRTKSTIPFSPLVKNLLYFGIFSSAILDPKRCKYQPHRS